MDKPLPKCWADGFRWIAGKNALTDNLKALDRQRERQINRVVRRMRTLGLQTPKEEVEHQGQFYGFPYSYRGQFGRRFEGDDGAQCPEAPGKETECSHPDEVVA